MSRYAHRHRVGSKERAVNRSLPEHFHPSSGIIFPPVLRIHQSLFVLSSRMACMSRAESDLGAQCRVHCRPPDPMDRTIGRQRLPSFRHGANPTVEEISSRLDYPVQEYPRSAFVERVGVGSTKTAPRWSAHLARAGAGQAMLEWVDFTMGGMLGVSFATLDDAPVPCDLAWPDQGVVEGEKRRWGPR